MEYLAVEGYRVPGHGLRRRGERLHATAQAVAREEKGAIREYAALTRADTPA